MRVSGIKGGAPRASPLPQDVLYTFSWRYILLGGRGAACVGRFWSLCGLLRRPQAAAAFISFGAVHGRSQASPPALHPSRWDHQDGAIRAVRSVHGHLTAHDGGDDVACHRGRARLERLGRCLREKRHVGEPAGQACIAPEGRPPATLGEGGQSCTETSRPPAWVARRSQAVAGADGYVTTQHAR